MENDTEEIICPTTPWYKKRRLLMVAMLLGFSLYFLYDYKIGYPKDRITYDTYWPIYQDMTEVKKDTKGWVALAKEKGWPESPKAIDYDYKLKEQLIWSIGTGIGGLALLAAYLRNKDRALRGGADHLITPEGTRIPFASVTKIDKRKWDNKGLAYIWWKDGATTKKAVIDDLIYNGAVKVLDRLMDQFHGELIDLERDPAPSSGPDTPADPDTPPQSTPAP